MIPVVQTKGRGSTRPFVASKAVFNQIAYTMVTEKSRLLSASAPMMLASFCMFHSFNVPHSLKLAGSSL